MDTTAVTDDRTRLDGALHRAQFPRSAGYDPTWLLDNVMGPHPLWLAEHLTAAMDLQPGMRVLDLSCGGGLTAVFLAREFGVQVWAGDLLGDPTATIDQARLAGSAERITPLRVEAHALPFPHGLFDAIISVDAYHYFGTDDLYLDYLVPFLRPGGQLGVSSPGVTTELGGRPPEHAAPYWDPGYRSFHSAPWWHRHWDTSGLVDVEVADLLPDGGRLWLDWLELTLNERDLEPYRDIALKEADMLRVDAGRTFGFVRLVARTRR